jgi:PIN domain nuclease of toxin-antitoxin system
VEAFVEKISSRTTIRPVTVKVSVRAIQLPAEYSGDPCDRLIGATGLAEGISLVTKDTRFRACKQVETIW